MFNRLNNKKGFTLIEIVIVIVIIAILAAILVPQLTKWIDKAKLARFKSEADTVRNAVAAYMTHEIAANEFDNATITDQNITTYAPNFWEGASESAGTTLQNTDSNKDGYTTFSIVDGVIESITYSSDGHSANYDGSEWTYD